MNENKPSKLKFGMFAGMLIFLAFLLIGTALYNTYSLTHQADINNEEMHKTFQQLAANEDDSYKSQLQSILIGQATTQLSQYSKNITTTATSNNNLLILWASGITLFTIAFVFIGFIEFKYKMQDASILLKQITRTKNSIDDSFKEADSYKREFKDGLSQLSQDRRKLSQTVTHANNILSKVEAISDTVQENAIISHLNLKIQSILNSPESTANKIEMLSAILKEINTEKQLKNTHWQALSEKCNIYLGQLSETIGNYKKAILFYDEAIRLTNTPLPIYLWRANIYTKLEQHRNAIIDYNQILQVDTDNAKVYYLRGCAYSNINEQEKALTDFDKSIDLDSQYAPVYNQRGLTHSLEDYDKAVADFDRAIKLDPLLFETLINKGTLFQTLEKYREAIIYFTQAIEIAPNNHEALEKRANCYSLDKQYEEAIRDYTILLNNSMMRPDTFMQRAKSYEFLSLHTEAFSDYDNTIRLDPNNKDAYIARGMLYYIENQFEEALSDLNKYLSLEPNGEENVDILKIIEEIHEEIE